MNRIFELVGSISVKMDDAVNSIDKITDKAEQSSNKMVGFFKKAAIGIGTVFAIDKVIDFSKMAVNAAAEAQALQAQFEQVFGNLQDEANDMIDGMASEFGMLPERLTPVFTKLTSKFKGLGVDSEEAMKMAERATTHAADAAANFDISMEDATHALNSYLNGESSAGEKIGLYANQTQLASWAVSQGLISQAKDWATLEDAQKQAMVLDYIDYTYSLNGAMGQASNEADGFENVMGNLKAAWQKFLVVVGGPILKAVIPILQGITSGIVWLAEVITPVTEAIKAWLEPILSAEEGFGSMFSGAQDGIKSLLSSFETVKTAILAIFDVLMGNKTTDEAVDLMEQLGMSDGAIGTILGMIDVLKVAIEGLSDVWDVMKTASEWAWNAIMDVAKLAIDFYSTYLQAIFNSISNWWKENQDTILSTVELVWNTIVTTLQFIFGIIQGIFYAVWEPLSTWFSENQELIKSTVETVWNAILAVIKYVMEYIVPYIVGNWNTIMEFLGPILSGIYAYISLVWNTILGVIKVIMQLITGDISGAWTTIKDIISDYTNGVWNIIKDVFGGMWETIVEKSTDMYNSVVEWFGKIPTKIEELWGQAQSFLEGINLVEIGKNIIQGLWNGISSKWDDFTGWFDGKISGFTQGFTDFFGINSPSRLFREYGEWISIGLAQGIEGALTDVDKAVVKMEDSVANASLDVPDVSMGANYAVQASVSQSTTQANTLSLMAEQNQLLKQILMKDTDISINGRTLTEEILDDINYLNDLYDNRNTRIKGGVAYP